MNDVKLKPFVRSNLDVLFVGYNPPRQSNSNGHYFSGKQSRFFKLLFFSGLITANIDKLFADEVVFSSSTINYKNANFGVTDLIPIVVETNSSKVKANQQNVIDLFSTIKEYKPKIACLIHSKVKDAIERYYKNNIQNNIRYGNCGNLLKGSSTIFFFNYFPNGNNIKDEPKLKIFEEIKQLL